MSETAIAVPAAATASPANPASRYSTGLMLALAGAFLYSWKPLWVKLLYGYGIDADTQLALRMLIALPFYAGYALYTLRNRQRKGEITDLGMKAVGLAMLTGLLGNYLAPYLDFVGLKYITAEFERLILFTYPTFVALIAWWSFRDRPSMALVASLALTYAGLALIFVKDLSSFGPQVATGTALVMGCSVAYAFYMAWSKWPIARMGSALFTSLSMLSATAALVAQFALRHPFGALAVPAPAMALAAAMAIGSTVLPSFLVSEAIARMGPGPASVTGGAGPIMTTLLAVVLLGEPLTGWHIAGMALVIAGVMVLSRRRA